MIKEGPLDKILYAVKKLIPKPVFEFFQPMYHRALAWGGALRYGFPSRGMKVIGVTGTKGKSTTVFMISKILETAGHKVAAIGSLGYKIRDKEWPNTLKMSMPGRFRLQRFLSEAKSAGCEFVVLEVTSEGIKQSRHLGVDFDTAVFTNIHREHLETHGSFENYLKAKQELFKVCGKNHVINVEAEHAADFLKYKADRTITFGLKEGDVHPDRYEAMSDHSEFTLLGQEIYLPLTGDFNISNALAAIAAVSPYGATVQQAAQALAAIGEIPGRMEFVQREPFNVVVDYAHTPDSLKAVYRNVKNHTSGKIIAVFGCTGGGRDKWKRPEMGKIADEFADEIILTDDDPYEEDRQSIVDDIKKGIGRTENIKVILDRREAIEAALRQAQVGDSVVITGKGSEPVMTVAGNKKIPWSDKEIVKGFLS